MEERDELAWTANQIKNWIEVIKQGKPMSKEAIVYIEVNITRILAILAEDLPDKK